MEGNVESNPLIMNFIRGYTRVDTQRDKELYKTRYTKR